MGLTLVRFTRAAACAAAALALCAAGCTGDPPPDDPTSPPTRSASPTSSTPTSSNSPSQSPDQALLDKVRAEGQLKVLVQLKLPQTPADRKARESAIVAAQDEVLAEVEPLGAEAGTRFKRTALLGLTVNEPALRQLLQSSLVYRVSENRVHRTQ